MSLFSFFSFSSTPLSLLSPSSWVVGRVLLAKHQTLLVEYDRETVIDMPSGPRHAFKGFSASGQVLTEGLEDPRDAAQIQEQRLKVTTIRLDSQVPPFPVLPPS